MERQNVELMRAAYQSRKRGDIEPYVSLLHPEVVWEGLPQGILWWRRTPS